MYAIALNYGWHGSPLTIFKRVIFSHFIFIALLFYPVSKGGSLCDFGISQFIREMSSSKKYLVEKHVSNVVSINECTLVTIAC